MDDICILKKLVSQFVDTYMGALNYFPLLEDDADYIVDHFRELLFEDYRPEDSTEPPADEDTETHLTDSVI